MTWQLRTTSFCALALALGAIALPTPTVSAADDEPAASSGDLNHPMKPIGEIREYRDDSGALANRAAGFNVVYSTVVYVEYANWLRLYFDAADLPRGSFVRVTAPYDGESQDLDADTMRMWSNSTAYFNGDRVYVDLIAAPATEGNRISIDRIGTEIAEYRQCGADCGICGADNRTPSTELWAGRLMPVGCSASVWSEESCLVSAGHCAQSGLVMQFNVPNSSSNCSTNNPPVADQFPVGTYQYQNGGVGADWFVMTTGTNNLSQKCYQRYGQLRRISTTLGNSGNAVANWGYGVDDDQPTRSQTQQTATGTINSRQSTYYTFTVDITYGNSGSALMLNDQIIGIVTHCSTNCPNYATRHDVSAFASARNSVCPDTTAPTPNPMTFSVAPAPVDSTSINMTATTATDGRSPPVNYEFDFTTGGAGGTDSGWIASTTYVDGGLTPNTSYSYRCRARDSASTQNNTGYSGEAAAITHIETPTGVTFGTVTSNSIVLNAAGTFTNLAVGGSGLWFDSTTSGGDGGINAWVQVTTDTATGLSPDTLYSFQAKARNQNQVETGFGPSANKATLALVPGAPTLSNAASNSMQIDVGTGGNPAITTFAIRCTATVPADANWSGKYVNAAGQPVAAEVWQTDAAWGLLTLTGMQPSTTYTFAVKAKNQENVQTAFGASASLATLSGQTLGDMNCDGVVNFEDINAFVLALSNPAAYQAAYPNCNILNGDCNPNGAVDFEDINCFVALLSGD